MHCGCCRRPVHRIDDVVSLGRPCGRGAQLTCDRAPRSRGRGGVGTHVGRPDQSVCRITELSPAIEAHGKGKRRAVRSDTGQRPATGTPPCSSYRPMIVDHLASPAVAGFSVSNIWDQGPGLRHLIDSDCDKADAIVMMGGPTAAERLLERRRVDDGMPRSRSRWL
jgi:hypothetical protein